MPFLIFMLTATSDNNMKHTTLTPTVLLLLLVSCSTASYSSDIIRVCGNVTVLSQKTVQLARHVEKNTTTDEENTYSSCCLITANKKCHLGGNQHVGIFDDKNDKQNIATNCESGYRFVLFSFSTAGFNQVFACAKKISKRRRHYTSGTFGGYFENENKSSSRKRQYNRRQSYWVLANVTARIFDLELLERLEDETATERRNLLANND